MKDYKKLFSKYYILTHRENHSHAKTLKSNYKFIFMAISRMIKRGGKDDELYDFMIDVIDVHNRAYETR